MTARTERLSETASQTAGPFVHIGLAPEAAGLERGPGGLGRTIAGPGARGRRIAIEGTVLDGAGDLVKDAVIEVWQANAAGIFRHPLDPRHGEVEVDFRGFGRAPADLATGVFRIETVKPGPVPGPGGRPAAPHLSLWVVARGINVGLHTRLYFPDEAEANAADPLLARLGARARTLVAADDGPGRYRVAIRLQGPDETVFFDV